MSCRAKHNVGKWPSTQSKRVKKNCQLCGKEYEVRKYRDETTKYCSNICSGKSKHILYPDLAKRAGNMNKGKPKPWQVGKKQSIEPRKKRSLAMRGDKAPNWQGGKTEESYNIRHSLDYKIWREAVFARDNWTCQNCRQKGGLLNADHIKPFSLYPELRFAIDNGRTLCVDCHKQTDTYGWRALRWQ